MQTLVARLAGEVLDRAPLGAQDHFFRLGGTSLLAARLAAALEQAFGVRVPLRAIFTGPSVAELAATVEQEIRAEIDGLDDADVTAQLSLQEEEAR